MTFAAPSSLYWSLFGAPARAAFLQAYGAVAPETLMRARVLALFLCATLAAYAADEGMVALQGEAVRGLERTVAE